MTKLDQLRRFMRDNLVEGLRTSPNWWDTHPMKCLFVTVNAKDLKTILLETGGIVTIIAAATTLRCYIN